MDDLISRAMAIEVADAIWSVTGDKNVAKVWDQLKDLPSAQPDVTDINVGDTISRQAAIAVADSADYVGLSVDDVKNVTDAVVKGLKQLPSAQPYTDEEIQKIQDLEQAELEKAFESGREDALSEIIRCKNCKKYDMHDHRCKHWNHGVVVMDWCSKAERRTEI